MTEEIQVMGSIARRMSNRPHGLVGRIVQPFTLQLFIAVAVSQALGAGPRLPRVPGGRVINLTGVGYFDEPSIAVNPINPSQLVAAYQVPAHVAYSDDGGAKWEMASGTAPSNYRISGDVSVTYDNHGRAFLCYIAFDKLGTENYWAHNATRNGVFVRRSLDGGRHWQSQAVPLLAHPTEPGIPFEDKPYIVADDSQGPYAGNLYVGWTHFTLSKSVIYFSRSTDEGRSWSAPARISTVPGLPRDDNGALEGFTGVAGPHSTLYVAWADGQGIVFTSSRDGGRTFATPRRVVATAPPYFKVEDVSRSNGFPILGMDPNTGRLYVAWSDYRNGDVDVFVSTSADRGQTWGPAVRVNSDPLHDGADQFFQWLAVDPTSGAVNVIFYDRRGDRHNRKAAITLARSTDRGATFANYAWTHRAFDAHDDFIGDYTGLAAYGGHVYGVWTQEAGSGIFGLASGPPPADRAYRRTFVRFGAADFGRAHKVGSPAVR
jgi:hypothetical protein